VKSGSDSGVISVQVGAALQFKKIFRACDRALHESAMLPQMADNGNDSLKPTTLYMVVEHFRNKDAVAVYRRFRDSGRMAPEGLIYVSSWVDDKFERCYQLMETHDRSLLDEWMANWSDLVEFEVHAVVSSKRAAELIAPRL
jgi:hypothetical protein